MNSFAADYIAVGGGLTGGVIASRLRQSGKKPRVLLEAGSDPSENTAATGFLSGLSLLGSEFDHAYQSEPVKSTTTLGAPQQWVAIHRPHSTPWLGS
ncbi:hypothetical protein F5Y19DRAFT_472885 [Xylariaceae sp. FL1651]|nr:hypothetical protein F5Y19DRAFT_472885 [Xylariaceae sp. FL1651]